MAKQGWILRFRKSPPHTQTNIVCTAIIALATGIYAVIAGFQLWTMRDTLTQMKTAGDQSSLQIWKAIDNMNWLARSADLSQKSTEQSVDDNRKSVAEDRRPWVGFVGSSCGECKSEIRDNSQGLKLGQFFRMKQLTGLIVNSGRTPAFKMEVFSSIPMYRLATDRVPTVESVKAEALGQIESMKKRGFDISWAMPKTIGVMAPSSTRTITFTDGVELGREFTADRSKLRVLYIVGRITYFGEDRRTKHVTDFCLKNETWSDGDSFVFCPTGNDMYDAK